MKKFTDTQKKWALTATMIAALGCSISFNPHTNGFAALDLASESDHRLIQLPTSKGVLDVHLIATGDKTTAVTSPVKNAEGKASFECKDCVTTMTLDKKITDDVADLQVAIMAQLVKAPAPKEEVVKAASTSVRDDEEEDTEVSEKQKERDERREEARLEKEERKAEQKREKDQYKDDMARLKEAAEVAGCKEERIKADKLACLTQAYKETLEEEVFFKYKNRKGNTITDTRSLNPKAALDFYVKNIESGIKSDLRRAGGNSALYDILSDIPSDFNNVRERALSGTTVALYQATVDYRDSIIRAKQTQNPADKIKAQQNQAMVQSMYRSLSRNNEYALKEAIGRGNIEYDEAADLYDRGFNRVASNLHDGASRWLTLDQRGQIVANLNAYQLPTPISGSFDEFDLNQTLGSSLPPGVLPAPGSNNRTTNARATVSAPTAEEVLDGTARPAIVVLEQGTSDGTQFGQPRSLTPEAKAEADRRNLLQGQRF